MKEIKYTGIGLMSGSSLDGLDVASCEFTCQRGEGSLEVTDWKILAAETLPYSDEWIEKLKKAPEMSGIELSELDAALGRHFGVQTLIFMGKHHLEPDFIASHGHTVFHYPNKLFTLQIGSGAALAAMTGYPVVDDFRVQDIALSGQGAPLAPIVDSYLFGKYDICLNIGGIANLSVKKGSEYIAFDVGGANQVLNDIVSVLGWPYDDGGKFAEAGQLQPELLKKVNELPFFRESYPKSLGNDWVREKMLPIFREFDSPVEDKLHTMCVQLANQIAIDLKAVLQSDLEKERFSLLVTGGGALNGFLVSCISEACSKIGEVVVVVPEREIIEYKEAALMALMGVLRIENIPSGITSVTGAREDTIAGAFHQGWKFQL